jgi:hypothetical protein
MNIELSYERSRMSKKAQKVIGDIDKYLNYYESVKRCKPPVIRVKSDGIDSLFASINRLKIEGDGIMFKGVTVKLCQEL